MHHIDIHRHEFQSLIGRLGTVAVGGGVTGRVGFQSLIGRLGTVHYANGRIRLYPFQSLIGRLGTLHFGALRPSSYDRVSIPHR